MTIAVSASSSAWRFYESGILTSADGCGTELDHAILLVGYGVDVVADITQDETISETSITSRKASRSEKRAKACDDGSVYQNRMCITTVITTTTTEASSATTETGYFLVQN